MVDKKCRSLSATWQARLRSGSPLLSCLSGRTRGSTLFVRHDGDAQEMQQLTWVVQIDSYSIPNKALVAFWWEFQFKETGAKTEQECCSPGQYHRTNAFLSTQACKLIEVVAQNKITQLKMGLKPNLVVLNLSTHPVKSEIDDFYINFYIFNLTSSI